MLEYIKEFEEFKLTCKNERTLEKRCKKLLNEGIKYDLQNNNYSDLIDSYVKYFSNKTIRKKFIKVGEKYFRARLGFKALHASKNENDTMIRIPYHDKEIMNAPNLFAKGERFNREGVSHLYLASDIETCLSEIRLQVGQKCSVGEFECNKRFSVFNLAVKPKDIEMMIWYEIITQPIHNDIKEMYLVTQFLCDVFKKINNNGILFKSSQSKGLNIVCFKPELFSLIPYSENIYKAKEISINYVRILDSGDIKGQPIFDTHNTIYENELIRDINYLETLRFRRKNKSNR